MSAPDTTSPEGWFSGLGKPAAWQETLPSMSWAQSAGEKCKTMMIAKNIRLMKGV
jgi:hypothetical protein